MKLCKRNYKDNSLLAAKIINGITCCTHCLKPTLAHGASVDSRALFWASSGDNGISSDALLRHMVGIPHRELPLPPSDADDRGRCIRLLELVPEWIERLPELVELDKKTSEELVINSSGIHTQSNSWAEQIPLIIKEGRL